MGEGDDDLVARVAQADHDACRQLVDRHLGRIVAFAARVLGDPDEAEDVAQEVFARLWTHARSWTPGRARFSTWLFRVALNLCRDRLARRRDVPFEEGFDPADPAASVAARFEENEMSRLVTRAVDTLPERQRTALALCHFQGLGNVEAATIMEVSVEALESLLARARRTLRERLRPLAPELLAGGRHP
jgi:RNA polymerase sigma-70 factor (ECF subfamily)